MINVCMVGTGGIATQHMKAFKELGGVCPRWVISRRAQKSQEFGQEWSFKRVGTELDQALTDPQVDLVVITSPSEQHVDQTTRALRAGKNVIVEIPVGLSLAEAENVAELARKLGPRVLVCHTMRSFPAIQEVRHRVQAGALSLTQIAGYFAIPRRRNQGMGGQERSWIDNLLWHHGCHMVDVAMWALGVSDVEEISALFGRRHPQFGIPTDLSIHFRTFQEQVVTHALTYNTEQFCWEVRFIGDQETLTYRNGMLLNERNEEVVAERSWVDLADQNKQMLATLTEGSPSDYDVTSVLPAMKVLQKAQNSALGQI